VSMRKIKHEAIPEWAQGLYYNKGLFSKALIYHDDEAIYFEVRARTTAWCASPTRCSKPWVS
jgi:hypothetical protein